MPPICDRIDVLDERDDYRRLLHKTDLALSACPRGVFRGNVVRNQALNTEKEAAILVISEVARWPVQVSCTIEATARSDYFLRGSL